jgi:hydrogenase maturation protease
LNSPVLHQGQVAVRKAGSPVDVLDWIEGIERLLICDACCGGGPPGFTYRWSWPDRAIERTRSSGSHDLGLAGVLKLAHRLQRLPQVVVVWGVEADTLKPQDDLSASVTARLPGIVDTIWSDLRHA